VRPREVQILDGVRQVEGMKLKAITKTRQQQILDAVAECGLTVTTHKEEPLTGLLQQSA
jgi:hypothetical protein